MFDSRPLHKRFARAVLPALALLTLAYFGYHAFHGNYGLFAYTDLVAQHDRLSAEAARLRETRERLEARVALMRPDHLNADWLDEEARRALGYLHPNDVVVITD